MTAHETQSPLGHTLWRSLAVMLVLLVFVATAAPGALAVEEATPAAGAEAEQEHLTYEELRENSPQRAQEFFPEEYEEPSFFQWISVPTMIIGLIIAVGFLGAYLWWQPKFAAERREKERR